MCRNIRPLFNFDPPATKDEIHDASLQFVRKVSGFRKPSEINEVAFKTSVEEVANVITKLLHAMKTNAQPRDREEEAQKRKEKSQKRFLRQS